MPPAEHAAAEHEQQGGAEHVAFVVTQPAQASRRDEHTEGRHQRDEREDVDAEELDEAVAGAVEHVREGDRLDG